MRADMHLRRVRKWEWMKHTKQGNLSNNKDSTHILVDSIWIAPEMCVVYSFSLHYSFFVKSKTLSTSQLCNTFPIMSHFMLVFYFFSKPYQFSFMEHTIALKMDNALNYWFSPFILGICFWMVRYRRLRSSQTHCIFWGWEGLFQLKWLKAAVEMHFDNGA